MSGPIIGPDGTAYGWMKDANGEDVIVALDTSGRMRPGWPFHGLSLNWEPSLVATADGSLLIGVEDEKQTDFALHRVGADGQEVAGWPYAVPEAAYCSRPVATADGRVVLSCSTAEDYGSTIVVIDAAGRVVPGWPAFLVPPSRLDNYWGANVQFGPDGTLYALGTPAVSGGMAHLWAFTADGDQRPGFPVTLDSTTAGFLLVPGRRIVVGSYIPSENPLEGLCADASSTILTELDAAGRVVPGWPVTAAGWVSRPVIGADGTVYYLASDRFFARAPDGSLRVGWPVAISPVSPECANYGPYLGADGTVYAMDDADGLAAFGPDGTERPGWPFQPAHGFAGWFCTMDAMGGPSPVLGPDGRVYAAVAGARNADGEPVPLQIVALDRTGGMTPGWPFTLPGTGRGEVQLLGVVNGRLYVGLSYCGESDFSTALLALDADGSLAD